MRKVREARGFWKNKPLNQDQFLPPWSMFLHIPNKKHISTTNSMNMINNNKQDASIFCSMLHHWIKASNTNWRNWDIIKLFFSLLPESNNPPKYTAGAGCILVHFLTGLLVRRIIGLSFKLKEALNAAPSYIRTASWKLQEIIIAEDVCSDYKITTHAFLANLSYWCRSRISSLCHQPYNEKPS